MGGEISAWCVEEIAGRDWLFARVSGVFLCPVNHPQKSILVGFSVL